MRWLIPSAFQKGEQNTTMLWKNDAWTFESFKISFGRMLIFKESFKHFHMKFLEILDLIVNDIL